MLPRIAQSRARNVLHIAQVAEMSRDQGVAIAKSAREGVVQIARNDHTAKEVRAEIDGDAEVEAEKVFPRAFQKAKPKEEKRIPGESKDVVKMRTFPHARKTNHLQGLKNMNQVTVNAFPEETVARESFC